MEPFAAVVLACCAAGFLVVGGAELGVAMLLPVLARDRAERAALRAASAPVARLAEGWLWATLLCLLLCFPTLPGALPGAGPLLGPLLLGWLLRGLGRWGRPPFSRGRRGGGHGGGHGGGLDGRGRGWPDVLWSGGSWLAGLACGWLLAALLAEGLSRPVEPAVALLSTVCVVLLLLAHGISLAALRATGRPFQRARQLTGRPGGDRSLVLTAGLLATLPPLAGARLPLAAHAAPTASLAASVPALLLVLGWLTRAQLRRWRGSRHDG
ncbi:cytochrome d ubiquinol oxidase subunit II [Streptomyces sp. DSM 44915]|uniref:Cytochrome d ubiquinol oxidase subunit II n=1 Tax=Streptomyces chisholmiae TaxID=3075540 RepID=A0ABU2K082_9ACTN|nr:cytochrome d ubiquinol oxidase subunit II [Streptomyces sp. DSM 44915]MDT0270411.1 cytochrome d ubiquinol oxidase subunit II [Streptomyces sp. DSM 44915]